MAGTAGVRIRIENGTTVPGLGRRVARDLRRRGFNVSDVRNAATSDVAVTRIESAPATMPVSQLVRQALGATAAIVVSSGTDPAPESPAEMIVVIGRDIVGTKP